MALGSWTGIYIRVIQELMEQRKEQELLLLLAIQKHCDPFGFCFPGRAKLMRMRHVSKPRYEAREAFLVDEGYIVVTEVFNARRRQYEPDFQVSPRALYVRPEVQVYCEAVFDGIQDRDFALEKMFLVNLFSTKESQPEALPESENRRSKPASGNSPKTRNHNQRGSALTQKGRTPTTMRNGGQPAAAIQPTAVQREAHREDNPQAGGPDEFAALLLPDVDDDRMIQEIRHLVATTEHQARRAVTNYPREGIVHWLEHTARRRQKGELANPGAYFFTMLMKHCAPSVIPEPTNPTSRSV